MNCRKVNNLLSAYMDGELAGVEQLQIRQHLRDCETCTAEYESLLLTKRMLAGMACMAPRPGLDDRILSRIAADGTRGRRWVDLAGWWTLLAEQQRSRIRGGALAVAFSMAGLLAVANPYNERQSNVDLASIPAFSAPAPSEPNLPLDDFLSFSHQRSSQFPMAGPSGVVPASYRTGQ